MAVDKKKIESSLIFEDDADFVEVGEQAENTYNRIYGRFNDMKTMIFTNFSNQKFTGRWAKQIRVFEPGESSPLPEYLANHFTRHLVTRELLKDGFQADSMHRYEYEKKAMIDSTVSDNLIDNAIDRSKLTMKPFVPDPKIHQDPAMTGASFDGNGGFEGLAALKGK